MVYGDCTTTYRNLIVLRGGTIEYYIMQSKKVKKKINVNLKW